MKGFQLLVISTTPASHRFLTRTLKNGDKGDSLGPDSGEGGLQYLLNLKNKKNPTYLQKFYEIQILGLIGHKHAGDSFYFHSDVIGISE